MKSVDNVIVNGREFFLDSDSTDSFLDMMEYIGIPKEEVFNYAISEKTHEEMENGLCLANSDGILGDDFYVLCDELGKYLNEFKEIAASLRSTSRKGNTRADIANQLDCVCSNFEGIIP